MRDDRGIWWGVASKFRRFRCQVCVKFRAKLGKPGQPVPGKATKDTK